MRLLTLFLALLPLAIHASELTGRVVDASGAPIPNAHVYIYTALPLVGVNKVCPSCYLDCGKHVAVEADGTYRIGKLDPKLKFRALAVAEGFEPMLSTHYVNPAKQSVDFTLKKRDLRDCERLVVGRVVDPRGKPVVGAVVERHAVRLLDGRIGYGNIPGIEPLSITNASGEFALRVDETSTKLDVRVRARNFAPEIARELVPGESRTIAVDVGASVAGRIVRGGRPAKDLYLKILHADRRSHNFLGDEDIATDDDGAFLVTGLGPNQPYRIIVAGGNDELKTIETGVDGTAVEVGTLDVK
ncbi:MAG TPA: carboxypeptidase-like regulatory domain-containing protein [Thermoanaerobaculia bacterium]|nr:carboxypeptidase-like regulatory domain-containing protein [Thermoanaerobaculia bacterium]